MNKLWRLGNRLSKMGGLPRKISRLLELMNHLICACSVFPIGAVIVMITVSFMIDAKKYLNENFQ